MRAPMSSPLPDGYFAEVDTVGKDQWHEVLDLFSDASIYQTWSYESMRRGLGHMSHLLLRHRGDVVAAVQLRIARIPFIRLGVAYARWGPMWRRRGRMPRPEVLSAALEAIRSEYTVRRGLSVRLLPYLLDDEASVYQPLLQAGQFSHLRGDHPQRTLLMPLTPPLPEIRSALEQKWRNCLNRAEKSGLIVEQGTDDDLFARFIDIHEEMRARKGFAATSDVHAFRRIQRDLPDRHKMRVFLAFAGGERQPAAGVVCSLIGDTGVFLHGATSNAGMPTSASHLLQWHAVGWLKGNGASVYNLHGINPTANPGTYRFKAGLGGRNSRDVHYLGTYAATTHTRAQALLDLAESARQAYRQGRGAVRKLQPRTAR